MKKIQVVASWAVNMDITLVMNIVIHAWNSARDVLIAATALTATLDTSDQTARRFAQKVARIMYVTKIRALALTDAQ